MLHALSAAVAAELPHLAEMPPAVRLRPVAEDRRRLVELEVAESQEMLQKNTVEC